MKNVKLLDLLKCGHVVVPLYLYRQREKFSLPLGEFFFLQYLAGQGEKFLFNPKKISEDLAMELSQVMDVISHLTDKNLVTVEVIKNEKNVREEYLVLTSYYEKISNLLIDEIVAPVNVEESTIFSEIEKAFGRTLSPMEFEIIKAWLENHTAEELIREALKEAVKNGVSNLRYMDKILYEWGKKGYTTVEDVKKHQFPVKEEAPREVFDYDWLEDEDDE